MTKEYHLCSCLRCIEHWGRIRILFEDGHRCSSKIIVNQPTSSSCTICCRTMNKDAVNEVGEQSFHTHFAIFPRIWRNMYCWSSNEKTMECMEKLCISQVAVGSTLLPMLRSLQLRSLQPLLVAESVGRNEEGRLSNELLGEYYSLFQSQNLPVRMNRARSGCQSQQPLRCSTRLRCEDTAKRLPRCSLWSLIFKISKIL